MTGRSLFAVQEPDQVARREQFLRDHPGSRIYLVELGGAIQAEVPDERTGETFVRTRYTLKELLDVLDELFPPAGDG